MRVKEIMSKELACCTPETSLQEVSKMMLQKDCGCIPVCETTNGRHVIGVVTDRDIVLRTIAAGLNPLQMTARDCMSHPVATVQQEDKIETAMDLMEENQIRRIPVVDSQGCCCGMLAQADLALHVQQAMTGELVQEVSKPGASLM